VGAERPRAGGERRDERVGAGHGGRRDFGRGDDGGDDERDDAGLAAAERIGGGGARLARRRDGVLERRLSSRRERHADALAVLGRRSARRGDADARRGGRRARLRARRHGTRIRGVAMVVPVWLALVALAGLAAHRRGRRALLWLSPALAAALLPTMLVYVEPRALLPLIPIAAIGAALALEALARAVRRRVPDAARRRRLVSALAVAGVAVLVAPAVRDYARATASPQPLQEVASSRRAVAHLLDQNLPADAVVASWHPAVAYFADREWRVLPYEPIDRVLAYARTQRISAIVLSRFEPSPLADPHPFQVLLLDPAGPAPDVRAPRLGTVEETPLVVVRRVLPAEGR
jgi:hypothetical protein